MDKRLGWYILITQAIGTIFYAVFSGAYFLAIPSIDVLSGEPVFKIPMIIFSILFVALVLVSLVIGTLYNKKK